MQCGACEDIFKFGDFEKHDQSCIEKVVECPMKCGCEIKRKDLDKHLAKDCLGERYKCNLCQCWVNMKVKDKHVCSNYLMMELIKKFEGIECMMKADKEF